MNYFRITLGSVLLLFAVNVSAQSLEKRVIGSAGTSASGSNVTVDYTIGETVVSTISNSSNILTQGFHQPVSGTVSIAEVSAFSYKVFPNPFTDLLQVELSVGQTSLVKLWLSDLYGRMVYEVDAKTLDAGNHLLSVNTQPFSAGTYILSVSVKENSNKLTAVSSKQLNLIR
jgi:hypothetical protein